MATLDVLSSYFRIEQLESRWLLSSYFLDPSFGQNGIATIAIDSATRVFAAQVTELSSGKILAIGEAERSAPSSTFIIAGRFNADGTVDTTFGTGGAVVSIEIDAVTNAAVDEDGSFFVLGHRAGDAFVARFTAAGALDLQFGGGDGVADFEMDAIAGVVPRQITIDPNGRPVVVGEPELEDDYRIGVVRLTAGGVLDSTFSGDGRFIIDWPNRLDMHDVAVQNDGRIVLAGGLTGPAVMARLNTDGTFDTSFAEYYSSFGNPPQPGLGVLIGVTGEIWSILTQDDGRILFGSATNVGRMLPIGEMDEMGFSLPDGENDFMGNVTGPVVDLRLDPVTGKLQALTDTGVMKYLANGEFDPSFIEDGTIARSDNPNSGIDYDVVRLDSADRVLDAGSDRGDPSRLAVARYESGVTNLADDGRLFVAGTAGNDTITLEADGNLARLTRNGDVTTYPLAEVLSVEVRAGEGDNTVSVLLDVATTVLAGSGDDTITTGDGADAINGGDGDNLVSIGAGGDVTTGSGNDTIVAGAGSHQITSGAGSDSITTGDGADSITTGDGDDVVSAGGGEDTISSGSGADSVDGGAGNDQIHGGDGANTVVGGEGNDSMIGGVDADSLLGGDGNDSIGAGHGANTVFAGAGNDSVCGGDDNDWFWGESGYDTIKGGFGGDFLHGGNGKDRLFGQQGNDRLYGTGNDDALDGGPGGDLMVGGEGNDKLWAADQEADTVDGGAGDDRSDLDDLLDDVQNVETLL